MSTTNQSNSRNHQFDSVLKKINEIVEKTQGEDYIYRGESELYPQVCSNLYRAYLSLGVKDPAEAVRESQELIVREATKFLEENNFYDTFLPTISPYASLISDNRDKFEILAQLQHYGGQTNLIDFTTDYLVALYFACAHSNEKCGRVICLQIDGERKDGEFVSTAKGAEQHEVLKMSTTIKRAVFQKSRFVETDNGIIKIEAADTIIIPKSLKEQLRCYLETYHGISANNIYGDIHGFIQALDIYPTVYRELYDGQMYESAGDSQEDRNAKEGFYKKAIPYYERASQKEKVSFEGHFRLGRVYAKREKFDAAIQNYEEAIKVDRRDATVYHALGDTYSQIGNPYYQKGEYAAADEHYGDAIRNYTIAIKLDSGNAKYYVSRGDVYRIQKKNEQAIEDYKQAIQLNKQTIQLNPKDIIMVYRDLYFALFELRKHEEIENLLITLADMDKDEDIDSLLADISRHRGNLQIKLLERSQNVLS